MNARRLRAVESAPQPPPDLSYEHRERARIMSRDWSRVHIAGDKAPALPFFQMRRGWRQ